MLSGLTWDPRTGRFFAVQDNDPHLVELRPAADSSAWSGAFLPADFGPHAGIEAVTRLGTSWLLADDGDGSPEVAHVFSLDASGRLGPAPFSLPALMQARSHNSGFEALGVSPDGGTVLLGQERPPFVRGHCLDNPLLLRVRLSDQHQEYFSYPLERDGGGADVGLSELAALSPSRALTLERGFTRGVGSGGRLFLSELGEGGTGEAPGALRKSLLVDLQQLPRERFDFPLPAGQTLHPAMGNYEGMTLGPCLDSGERSLVLLTDDNADSDPTHGGQPRHLLVLSLATEP